MINMAYTPEEAKEECSSPCATADGEGPKYPYGLELSLDDAALKKLGITDLPDVGYVMNLKAVVIVTRVSSSQSQDNEAEKNCSMQITDMEVSAPTDNATLADRLYT